MINKNLLTQTQKRRYRIFQIETQQRRNPEQVPKYEKQDLNTSKQLERYQIGVQTGQTIEKKRRFLSLNNADSKRINQNLKDQIQVESMKEKIDCDQVVTNSLLNPLQHSKINKKITHHRFSIFKSRKHEAGERMNRVQVHEGKKLMRHNYHRKNIFPCKNSQEKNRSLSFPRRKIFTSQNQNDLHFQNPKIQDSLRYMIEGSNALQPKMQLQ